MTDKKKEPMQYKVLLPIVMLNDEDENETVSTELFSQIHKEYEIAESGEEFTEAQLKKIEKRGPILDYRKSLIVIAKKARNPEKGIDFNEGEIIRPIIKKIKQAESGSFVLLTEGEFKQVCERAKLPHTLNYSELYDNFLVSLINSEKVEVKTEEIAEKEV